jgi:hypothetical protein
MFSGEKVIIKREEERLRHCIGEILEEIHCCCYGLNVCILPKLILKLKFLIGSGALGR